MVQTSLGNPIFDSLGITDTEYVVSESVYMSLQLILGCLKVLTAAANSETNNN